MLLYKLTFFCFIASLININQSCMSFYGFKLTLPNCNKTLRYPNPFHIQIFGIIHNYGLISRSYTGTIKVCMSTHIEIKNGTYVCQYKTIKETIAPLSDKDISFSYTQEPPVAFYAAIRRVKVGFDSGNGYYEYSCDTKWE